MLRKICVFAALVFILLVLLSSCGTVPSVSLRVATYNTHLLSPLMRCAEGLTAEEWLELADLLGTGGAINSVELADCVSGAANTVHWEAADIAREILAANYDVVALNEVFSGDAENVLVDALQGVYPHYVSYFHEGAALEDSGLMIFSKFPFAPLPHDNYRSDVDGTTDEVAFTVFNACEGVDCHADKGAALVRVQVGPESEPGSVYTIIFTHFQADSDSEREEVRIQQFAAAVDMARGTLEGPSSTDTVLLIGDLNVYGEGGQWEIILEEKVSQPVGGQREWLGLTQMANLYGPANTQLVDAWASFVPAEDMGITYPSSDRRYDYMFVTSPLAEVDFEVACVQQLKVHAMGPSDHLAVSADVNARNDYCHPKIARIAQFEERLDGRIEYPGAMQWYLVEYTDSNTVSIGVEPAYDPATAKGVDFEVYAPEDLTNPIQWYDHQYTTPPVELEMEKAKQYLIPQRFYVRVFSPNRSWTGDYAIAFHEHDCSSLENSCMLAANTPYTYPYLFPEDRPLGTEDSAWFQIDITEQADSGAAQPLMFFADTVQDAGAFYLELVEKDNPGRQITLPNEDVVYRSGRIELTGETATDLHMYLRLQRDDPAADGSYIQVGWETPLTRMHGDDLGVPGARAMRLVCTDETNGVGGNEIGEDEIQLMVNVDRTGWQEILDADYDCNNASMSKEVGGVFRYLEDIEVVIIEGDNADWINPDDHAEVIAPGVLPVDHFGAQDQPRVWNRRAIRSFEGGEYRFYFSLSHPFPAGEE